MKFLAKGKRGHVYLEKKDGKFICIKKSEEERISNEVYWLKILNEEGVGPKLLKYDENSFCYEFIDGNFILNYLEGKSKDVIKKIVKKILNQCRKMDRLKVNKFEMHKPLKHIIIKNDMPIMIDFERCRESLFPKNVTQFCHFLTSNYFKNLLKLDRKIMIKTLKEYKKDESEKNFRKILKFVNEC